MKFETRDIAAVTLTVIALCAIAIIIHPSTWRAFLAGAVGFLGGVLFARR